jgi:hypothetical protein
MIGVSLFLLLLSALDLLLLVLVSNTSIFPPGSRTDATVYFPLGCFTVLLTAIGVIWVFVEARPWLPALRGRPVTGAPVPSRNDLVLTALSLLFCLAAVLLYLLFILAILL